MNKTIKTGNPFSTLFIMRESKSREAIEIPNDMQISSKIVNASGQEIAVCEVTVCDQTEMKGGFILYVDKSITTNWKAGTALGDIKINGKNSGNYSFTIEKSIT
ncbi:MAG: hypothetical protein O2928_09300 [Proteobacteria bacterium]|uniref:hypothetical protein n=1 Tax=Acinetobacter venetianus TaxID=52133 RepID=UPI00214FAC57|nr:hypothetical protein [Acinetobacter venetianus]MCR4529848.1 hypothetical protein [Acinetobacter venetianus]MDA1254673.1 hypothetical protein [Pseudomonadota bacterium]